MNSSEYRLKAAHAARLAKGLGPGEDADRLRLLDANYEERAAKLEASIKGAAPPLDVKDD